MRLIAVGLLACSLSFSVGSNAQSVPSLRVTAPLSAEGGVPKYEDARLSDAQRTTASWLAQGNYQSAIPALQDLARDGDGWAMREIGRLYADGRGVAPDSGKALGWFYEAALADDKPSMLFLGIAFSRGYGVDRDPSLAKSWLQRARASDDLRVAGAAADELRRL